VKVLLLMLFSLILFTVSVPAFAQETHNITIPSGALYPNSPYFWLNELTGDTTGEITIFVGDTITWKNVDSAFHTVTSVDSSGEIDGVFDSNFIKSGGSYSREFTELGDFYYFCNNSHPWMNGVVHVVKNSENIQIIDRIASEYLDDGLGYDVKYILDTNLQNTVHIDTEENTLTFTISGDTNNEEITLIIPPELIENPNAVWVDGVMIDFEMDNTITEIKLVIPITSHSKEIKIMGTHVIPEFGFLVMGVLSVGLISTILFTRSKFSII